MHLWDVRTGKLIRELDQGSAGAMTLEFSPDGRILAVSGFEPVASLWDVATGAQIGPRLTAGSRRAMIDLSPDGRRLLMTARQTAREQSGTSTRSRGRGAPARSRTAR